LATGTGYTNFNHTKYLAALKTECEWNIFKLLSTHLFAAVSSQPWSAYVREREYNKGKLPCICRESFK